MQSFLNISCTCVPLSHRHLFISRCYIFVLLVVAAARRFSLLVFLIGSCWPCTSARPASVFARPELISTCSVFHLRAFMIRFHHTREKANASWCLLPPCPGKTLSSFLRGCDQGDEKTACVATSRALARILFVSWGLSVKQASLNSRRLQLAFAPSGRALLGICNYLTRI